MLVRLQWVEWCVLVVWWIRAIGDVCVIWVAVCLCSIGIQQFSVLELQCHRFRFNPAPLCG